MMKNRPYNIKTGGNDVVRASNSFPRGLVLKSLW